MPETENTIYYAIDSFMDETFDVRYLPAPGKAVIWFRCDASDPGEASQEFKAKYGQNCVYVSLEKLLAMAPKHYIPQEYK